MFLQRTAVLAARRVIAAPAVKRTFATSLSRRTLPLSSGGLLT
jgi:hypothetical protein